MKRLLLNGTLALLICFSACTKSNDDGNDDDNNGGGGGSTEVYLASTAPENKNVVLEDFTGVRCGFCPDGHVRAKAFSDANPGRVNIIAVHAGPYANPATGWDDFTTPFGQALVNQSSVTGYPAGTINRIPWTTPQKAGGLAMSRGEWAKAGAVVLAQPSPVNIGVKSTFVPETRELIVTTDLYYTLDETIASNLNVALLEDGVMSKQSGAPNPNAYEQNHILRHLLTGQWGEDVGVHKKGERVKKTYKYTVPASINIDKSKVSVFVSHGQKNILTGKTVNAK